jgi:hypothetical protein
MRRSTIAGVATFGVALLVASSAWAACIQADLTGMWRVHVHGATPGEGSFWTRCAITIAATTGNVSGSCRTDENVNFNLTGRLTITIANGPACLVTGSVSSPQGVNRILDAAMDRGKTVISGVGIDPEAERFAFTAVKR